MYPGILQKFDNFLVWLINKYANYRWYKSPLARMPLGTAREYLAIAEKARIQEFSAIDSFEKEKGFAIDKEWMHQLALHTQVVIKKSEINYQHGRLLYATIRHYIQKHQPDYLNIIETGTARGFSSLCMAKALSDSQLSGKIFTFDVLPHRHSMYWNCIDDLEGKKSREELLNGYKDLTDRYIVFHQGNTINELPKLHVGRIHFAFIDGGHDYYHVMKEFKHIAHYQTVGDIIFFDDYTVEMFTGVVKAVDEICDKFGYHKEILRVDNARAYAIACKK